MGTRSRVVTPDTARIEISDGDYLVVKKRLTHGERQEMFARKYLADGQGARLNLHTIGLDFVLAYLLDWTLTDLNGSVIPIRGAGPDALLSALDALDPEKVDDIKTALEAHVEQMQRDRTAEKNGPAGATGSAATAPSPFAAAGNLTGSGT